MNGYIIEPMWFYWVRVLDNIKEIAVVALILGVVAGGFCFLVAQDCFSEEEYKLWKKKIIISFCAVVLSAIILVFVPSRETLVEMKIAEFGTYENVTTVIETIEDMTDKIIEQIK